MCPKLSLPKGLFFGGGVRALNQLGIEAWGIVVVMLTVFILSYLTPWLTSKAMKSIIVRETGTSRLTHGFEGFELPQLLPNHLTRTREVLHGRIPAQLVE
jgi:hypothetical protein